jgi:hypothetical protein
VNRENQRNAAAMLMAAIHEATAAGIFDLMVADTANPDSINEFIDALEHTQEMLAKPIWILADVENTGLLLIQCNDEVADITDDEAILACIKEAGNGDVLARRTILKHIEDAQKLRQLDLKRRFDASSEAI